MKTTVWVTTRFIGFHRWKDAPDEVAFLREWHRHVFHVRLEVPVRHDNRDVEFLLLKQKLENYISDTYSTRKFEYSCEQIANNLLVQFQARECQVSEDGENGATVRSHLE